MYMPVTAPQGVSRPNGFFLTDPSFHSLDDLFGETNFGKPGMKSFFQSHECNKVSP
jgi:hypothetical protein